MCLLSFAAEESTTTSLDAAAIDAADASAASLAAVASPSAPIVAATAAGVATQQPPVRTTVDENVQLPRSASAPAILPNMQDTAAAAASQGQQGGLQQQQQQPMAGQVPGLPNNVNLLLELQRRWGLYQLQRMGRTAQESLSSASRVVRGLGYRFETWEDKVLAEASGVTGWRLIAEGMADVPAICWYSFRLLCAGRASATGASCLLSALLLGVWVGVRLGDCHLKTITNS